MCSRYLLQIVGHEDEVDAAEPQLSYKHVPVYQLPKVSPSGDM